MPTSDDYKAVEWQSWQPQNLLDAVPEKSLISAEHQPSDEQIKAELARIKKQAEQQGYSQGLARGEDEGRKKGFEAGLVEGREAGLAQGLTEARTEQMASLQQAEQWVSNFRLAIENLDSLVPGRLVQLSLAAVKQLYGSISIADNAALMQQIRVLLKQDALLHGAIALYVHPDARSAVAEAMGETLTQAGWELHSDPALMPGGCRVASAGAELDASLETRWESLCQLASEELSQ